MGVAVALMALLAAASVARAQMVFDGNVLWKNNASVTLAGQFTGTTSSGPLCTGKTPAQFGTIDNVHNIYVDPMWSVTNPPQYVPNTIPDFRPQAPSAAFHHTVLIPPARNADGFFEQTCYAGALPPEPDKDWTLGWTYWDSTGANRHDLHLASNGDPNPRPLATYANVNLYSSRTFSADSNYYIQGQLRVKEQANLTVAPGVVILEDGPTIGTIVVERGAKIIADGTRDSVIIITTADPPGAMQVGDCGGLVINGRARTNLVNSCAGDSAASEGGAIGFFGGNDDHDNSGILRYVRIEFSGREITPNNELNSFTNNAVGDGTIHEYLEAFEGADDSYETFGGTVSPKHLVLIDSRDDGFDWQMGYTGRAQFVICRQSPYFAPSLGQNGDKGIEADNNEFDFEANVCTGYSNPVCANFTLIGDKRVGPNFPGPTSAVNLRRGTAGIVVNSILYDFKTAGLKIDDNSTWQHHCAALPPATVEFCGGDPAGVSVATGNVFLSRTTPNPFRSELNFSFSLPQAGRVTVEVFAADGRQVKNIDAGELAAGQHSITWNLERGLPTGMYFYRVRAGSLQSTGKVTRLD
jgi:hypothetical protein